MAKSYVGLDIGSSMVRAAEVQRQGKTGQSTLVRYAEVPLPAGSVNDASVVAESAVASAIQQLWREGKFSSKNVAIGVGSSSTAVREIEVPMMAMAELRKSLAFQVQDMLPMPVDEAVLDFVPGVQYDGKVGTMVRGMLVAATKKSVAANVEAAEAAKLHVEMVDLNALALLRASQATDPNGGLVAVVDIGASMTTVAVSDQGVPRMVRIIPNGGNDATEAIAREMKVPNSEAEAMKLQAAATGQDPYGSQYAKEAVEQATRSLVESLRSTFVYYKSTNPGKDLDRVVLTGGGAMQPGLAQALANATRRPIVYGDPLAGMTVDARARERITAPLTAAIAVGLAQAVAA